MLPPPVAIALLALSLTLGLIPTSTTAQATPSAESATTPATCPTTTEDQNVALARIWHEEAINQGNLAALEEILAPDVVHHAAGGYPDVTTASGVMEMMGQFPPAFSDLHYAIDFFVVQDDMVVERYTASGTQDGPFGDLPPSGRQATWTGINIFRIECGQIAEVWSEVDALSRLAQLTADSSALAAHCTNGEVSQAQTARCLNLDHRSHAGKEEALPEFTRQPRRYLRPRAVRRPDPPDVEPMKRRNRLLYLLLAHQPEMCPS